jgi:RNA polymerase sigma factor (sigma-70 family)
MHLIYETGWNFWKFYQENQKDVETILWRTCWQNKNRYDPEDMHSEILLRLYNHNPLETYDPSESQLNTYLTGRIWHESQHVLAQQKDVCSKKQILVKGINTIDPLSSMYEEESLPELIGGNEIEDEVCTKDLIEKVNKRLPDSLKKIFALRLAGLNFTTIAKIYGVSCWFICRKCAKIQKLSARFLKRNAVHVQPAHIS